MNYRDIPAERRARWDELCEKIEVLIREYGDVIIDQEDICDEHNQQVAMGELNMPDFDSPLSIMDWSLVFSIEDNAKETIARGYWTLHVEPARQLPYRTRGLLESRLDMI